MNIINLLVVEEVITRKDDAKTIKLKEIKLSL